jgi:DNA-binding NarL/FixJ family response regulator
MNPFQGTGMQNLPASMSSPDALREIGLRVGERPYARRGVPVSAETIRIILVDDHAIVREGLRLLLRPAPDVAVIGEADSGVSGLTLAQQLNPDLVVLDLDMPGGDGLSALRALSQTLPNVRVLILTMYAEQDRLLALLEAGARGYLTKQAAAQDLVEAIRVVHSGEIYVRPSAARLLAAAVVPERTTRSAAAKFHQLSDREQTILRMVAQGYSGAEIARGLQISSKTVAAYKQRIHEKVGLEHRTDYVRFAVEAGVIGS